MAQNPATHTPERSPRLSEINTTAYLYQPGCCQGGSNKQRANGGEGGGISADSDPCDTPNLGCQSASRPHRLHFRDRSHQSRSPDPATVFSSLLKACARVAAGPGCSSKPAHYPTALSPSLQMGIGEGFNYILFYEKD